MHSWAKGLRESVHIHDPILWNMLDSTTTEHIQAQRRAIRKQSQLTLCSLQHIIVVLAAKVSPHDQLGPATLWVADSKNDVFEPTKYHMTL
jgi:hypothetical protein